MIIDVIGTIYTTVSVDENGESLFSKVDGYHVNTNEPIPGKVALDVKTPFRKFAGSNVLYCYKFGSQEEFEGLNLGN